VNKEHNKFFQEFLLLCKKYNIDIGDYGGYLGVTFKDDKITYRWIELDIESPMPSITYMIEDIEYQEGYKENKPFFRYRNTYKIRFEDNEDKVKK
jgi:hypothetical protein